MPEVSISIGGRSFDVACKAGEEQYLIAAAEKLDAEAQELVGQIGRVPEPRMLLMAGLMLADKTAAAEERVQALEAAMAQLETELAEIRDRPAPEPQRIEVPVIPEAMRESLAEIAARAEALAAAVEEKSAPPAQKS